MTSREERRSVTVTDSRVLTRSHLEERPGTSYEAIAREIVPNPGTNRDDEEYNMLHPRRGYALIFNHTITAGAPARDGSDRDREALEQLLRDLGFEVILFDDLCLNSLLNKLKEVSNLDHSDADCLVVVVLTHGEPGKLWAMDVPYDVHELWKNFTGDNCRTLAGKPKIFFIQACRGTRVDRGTLVRTQTDSGSRIRTEADAGPAPYMIPTQCDILMAYSTVKGNYSFREPENGSWFIQILVQELRLNADSKDLQTILTFVCRRVALEKEAYAPENPTVDGTKQCPSITSTLTRLVYFRGSAISPD